MNDICFVNSYCYSKKISRLGIYVLGKQYRPLVLMKILVLKNTISLAIRNWNIQGGF